MFDMIPAAVRAFRAAALLCLTALAVAGLAAGPVNAGETTTALRASKAESVFSEPVTLTATVKATGSAPSGTVQFEADGKAIGAVTLPLPGGALTYTAVAPGTGHTCALLNDSSVQCWGNNGFGRLGDGTADNRLTPAPVIGLAGPVTAIATLERHICALVEGGAVQCWGKNNDGQLGDGTADNSPVPVSVTGLAGPATAVAASDLHTCALIQGGSIQCWGDNTFGKLGDGSTDDSLTPVSVVGLAGAATAIAVTGNASCALIDGGTVRCWGLANQLGADTSTSSSTPVDVVDLDGPVTAISGGDRHFCALIDDGTVQCWGFNDLRQMGAGAATQPKAKPVSVTGLGGVTVTAIDAGLIHTCALIDGGTVRCWGHNGSGALGDGSTTDAGIAVSVIGLSGTVVAVAAGGNDTCAILDSGSLQCWGTNDNGQLGNGGTANSSTPVDVLDPTVSRTASLKIDDLNAGTHALTASYDGDADNDPSASDALSHTVGKAGTKIRKIKLKPGKPKAGQKARATVDVSALSPATAIPSGKMQVKLGRRKIGTFTVKNGKAKFRLPKLNAGKHTLKAKFQKSATFKDSTGKKTVRVKKK
jgi:alpha-tubulin suppressor-like RCC1 family protein